MTAPGFEPGSSGSQPLMLTTTPCHHVRVSGLGKNLWSRCFTKELSVNARRAPPNTEKRTTGNRLPRRQQCSPLARTRNQRMCHRENTVFATQEQKKPKRNAQDPQFRGHLRGKEKLQQSKKIDVQQSKKRIKKASPRRDSNPQPPDPKSDTLSIAPRGPP